MNRWFRFLLALLMGLLVACSLAQELPPIVLPPTPEVWQHIVVYITAEGVMAHVRYLADDGLRGRAAGSSEEDIARRYIIQHFEAAGLAPFATAGLADLVQPFPIPAGRSFVRDTRDETLSAENVVGVIPGTTYPERVVMIGAHYDHIGVNGAGSVFNGADDDASGVAAVLETATAFRALGLQPQETVTFVCFSAEEVGGLGSQALAEQLVTHGLAESVMLINVEIIGAIQGDTLDVWDEDMEANEVLVEGITRAASQLGVKVRRRHVDPGSDARRFNEYGIVAVSIDWDWSPANHPHYHSVDDDVQRIAPQAVESATEVGAVALWMLANDGR